MRIDFWAFNILFYCCSYNNKSDKKMGNTVVVAEEPKTPVKTIHVYVSVEIEFDVPVPKGNYDCAWLLAES